MAYRDCPCLNCKDRSHGSKRVACQTGCEKYLSWKAKEQELRRKEKESHPYYSETRQKIMRKHQLKRKGGRRI
jgi:hypothetical protein